MRKLGLSIIAILHSVCNGWRSLVRCAGFYCGPEVHAQQHGVCTSFAWFLMLLLGLCVCTCVRTRVRACVRGFVRSFVRACLRACVCEYLCNQMSAIRPKSDIQF